MRYFFVCGAQKSGTTWFQRLLDAHPALICSGEGHFIRRVARPMFEVIRQYNEHLQIVAKNVYEGKPYYDEIELQELARVIREFIISRMSKRIKPGAVAIGDKTPRYVDTLRELRLFFPEARFLHIVRDPRDVVVSVLHQAWRAGYSDALTTGSQMQIENAAGAARVWLRAQEHFADFAEDYPDQCLEVRYEDLCLSPHGTMERTFGFLGVSASAEVIQSVIQGASFETWSGRKPGDEDKSSFFRRGVMGDWTRTLDQSIIKRVTAICGPWLDRKGYDADSGASVPQ
jgi:hypothetical protein